MSNPIKSASRPGTRSAARPVTRDDAEAAVRTLIQWAGDDPAREGLQETPARVVARLRGTVRRL